MNDTVKHFLAGTFHQDMGSPEEALQEFIQETDEQYSEDIAIQLECFLNSRLMDQEKNDYIEQHTDIYFPAMQMKPIEWLQFVMTRLRRKKETVD